MTFFLVTKKHTEKSEFSCQTFDKSAAPPVSPSPKSSPDKNHSAIAASREPSAESAPQTICQEPSEATPTSQPPILGSQAVDQKSAPSKTPNQADSSESSLVIQSTVSLSAPNQNVSQVRPQSHFFLCPFCKKNNQ